MLTLLALKSKIILTHVFMEVQQTMIKKIFPFVFAIFGAGSFLLFLIPVYGFEGSGLSHAYNFYALFEAVNFPLVGVIFFVIGMLVCLLMVIYAVVAIVGGDRCEEFRDKYDTIINPSLSIAYLVSMLTVLVSVIIFVIESTRKIVLPGAIILSVIGIAMLVLWIKDVLDSKKLAAKK